MACKEIQHNIEAYLDGELTLSDRRDFEEHLTDCPECQLRLEGVRQLNSSIKKLGYSSRPAGMRGRIKTGLRDISGEDSTTFGWTQLLGFGGMTATLASLTVWAGMSFMLATPARLNMTDELISAHVRSMLVSHITDVASTDRHTVKPWFNGKLDFSPTVVNYQQQGYPLVGGRLDYLDKQTVAALVYKRRAHVINLFIRKSDAEAVPSKLIQRQGYQVISWQEKGLRYSLVSDLNSNELLGFAQMVQAAGH